jgi:4-amino-4-deoxy-L-arabinose transferase-like glycosyltransferase
MATKNKFISSAAIRHLMIALMITGIFSIGLILRVEMIEETVVVTPIMKDAEDYYFYAYNLTKYGVYSRQRPGQFESPKPSADTHRPPGYPLFLLPFVTSPPTLKMVSSIVVAQAIISALTILAAIGCFRSFLTWPWTFCGALLVAISPHLVAFNIYVLTESLFTFFLVLLTWAMAALSQSKTRLHGFIVGLVTGVSFLIRPTMMYFIAFLIPVFFVFFKKKKAPGLALFLIIGFCVTYGPWMVRNIQAKADKSSLAIGTIHKGMYPDLIYNNDSKTYGSPNSFDPTWDQRRDTPSVLKEISRRIKKDPLKYIRWYIIGKPAMFFSWNTIVGMGAVFIYPVSTSPYHHPGGFFDLTYRVMKSLHGLLTALALATSIFLWFPIAQRMLTGTGLIVARFVSLLLLYFILVHIAGTPLPRYSVPLRPFIYGLSILGIRLMVTEGSKFIQKMQTES